MIRGTTPTHVFRVPFTAEEIRSVRVLYAQGDALVLTRTKTDCTVTDGEITLTLTQTETLRFAEGAPVQVQLRVLTADGRAFASRVMTLPLAKCLEEVAIS